jgi:hypothetical protein
MNYPIKNNEIGWKCNTMWTERFIQGFGGGGGFDGKRPHVSPRCRLQNKIKIYILEI